MGKVQSPINVTPGVTVLANIDNPTQMQSIRVSNKSSYDISANGFGINGQEWLAAGVEYMLYAYRGNQGYISFTPFNTANLSPPPSGVVLITEYYVDEKLPHGQWPVSIPSQIVQGNLSVTTLINDGSVANTTIVEATVSGDVASAVKLTNDGVLTLGDAAHHGSISVGNGAFTVDGTTLIAALSGILNFTAAAQTLNGTTAGNIQIWQPTMGDMIITIMKANNYKNASGVRQSIALTHTYSNGCFAWIGGILQTAGSSNAYFLSGGIAKNVQQVGLGAFGSPGGFNVAASAPTANFYEVDVAFDTIQLDGGNTGNSNGWAILIGS